ncbi:hypothetical protein M514_01463 [Trichuris suis]|uniref:Uncharacterized protein n=1 Tax=Trichuris suis TaxID=68888 RepID=A0A085N7N6_9BILA|nr:hypothetical protein M514_01463 [Trichuris suis]
MKRAYIITVLILLPSFVVSAPTDECPSEGGTRKFIQRQLEGKTSCYELTRSECLFIHEAIDTCACTCDVLIKSSEDTARQTYTAEVELTPVVAVTVAAKGVDAAVKVAAEDKLNNDLNDCAVVNQYTHT